MVVREQDRVRPISRGGYDWADRFPTRRVGRAGAAAGEFRDGRQVVVLLPEGTSDFDALASRKPDKRALPYAFDIRRRWRGPPSVVARAAQGRSGRAALGSCGRHLIAEYKQGDIGDVWRATWDSRPRASGVQPGEKQPASISP
jgi:hypothetical protein